MMSNEDRPIQAAPLPLYPNTAPLHPPNNSMSPGKTNDAAEKHLNRTNHMSNSAPKSAGAADKNHMASRTFVPPGAWLVQGRSKRIMNKTPSGMNDSFLQFNNVHPQENSTTKNNTTLTAAAAARTNHYPSTTLADSNLTMSNIITNQSFPTSIGERMPPMNTTNGGILALALDDARRQALDSKKRKSSLPVRQGHEHDNNDSDGDDESLAGRNGVEYSSKPDVGMFGEELDDETSNRETGKSAACPPATQDEDHEFWDTKHMIRQKTVNDEEKNKEQSVVILESPPFSPESNINGSGKSTLPFPKSDDEEATEDEDMSNNARETNETEKGHSPPSSPGSRSAIHTPPPNSSFHSLSTTSTESLPTSGSQSILLSPPSSRDSLSTSNDREKNETDKMESPPNSGSTPTSSPDSLSGLLPVANVEVESNVPGSKKRKQNSQGSDDSSPRKRKPQNGDDSLAATDQPRPKKARKRRIASKSSRPAIVQTAGLRLGERVYATWKDGYHYWGVVASGNDRTGYTILYDDDDTWDGISRKDIVTVEVYRDEKCRYAPPLVERESDALLPRMTLEELYEAKCGACVNCEKEDCGLCASCISVRDSRRRQVCLQKMCCNVPCAQKAQPMPLASMFPVGWKYVMDPTRKSYKCNGKMLGPTNRPGAWGLKIIPPIGQEFYSAEGSSKLTKSLNGANVNVEAFYQHIGAPESDSTLTTTRPLASTNNGVLNASPPSSQANDVITNENATTVPQRQKHSQNADSQMSTARGERVSVAPSPRMTLEELYEAKCGACVNCDKEDCGLCASCISTGDSNRRQVCLQKMCCNVSLAEKTQPMPPAANFPDGWKYVMDPTRKSYRCNGKMYGPSNRPGAWGLKIIPPAAEKEFYSVERAIKSTNCLKDVHVEAFYQHIGAPESDSSLTTIRPLASTNNGALKASLPSSEVNDASTTKSTTTVVQNQSQAQSANSQTSATRSESSLPKYRKVGSRVCYMEEETEHWGTLEEKHGSGPTLSFTVRLEEDNSLLKRLDPADVLSEFHYKQETGKFPPPQLRTQQPPETATEAREGATLSSSQAIYITTKDDPLVGRNVCFSWTDLQGRKKILYGVVSECKKNAQTGEADSFKVVYDSKSRDLVNEINTGSVSVVPAESQMLPASLVRGGCIRYDQQLGPARQDMQLDHYWNWITPDMRHEDFVEMDSARMPRLLFVVRGYRLELNARESSIEGAGYGVYVSCTPLFDNNDSDNEPLVLKAGELVDLGLYGPFRFEDTKKWAVFFTKNFIHSHKCEEWTFDLGDSQYQVDITDDISGDIHSEAKKHVLAYVNESDLEECVCIHAEHDAEGSVHYLLGHPEESQGDFVLPSNGDPIEIFVNYGDEYEVVRLRKGYSFLPDGPEKNRLVQDIANEVMDDITVIRGFGAADAESVLDFMLDLFIKVNMRQQMPTSESMVHRALVVAVVLQCRARQIFLERNARTNEDAAVNLKKLLRSSGNLVTLLLDMIRDDCGFKMLHASGSVDKLCAAVLKKQFPNMDLSKSTKLEDLMGY